jgi:2-keto-4-pentenoate hydratase/2-oxohepta-3-ene-1,7-dioic acid hydratase in catechol pathway
MKIVSYRERGSWRAGIMCDGCLADVAALDPASRDAPSTVRALLRAGQAAIDRAIHLARKACSSGAVPLIPLEGVEIGPPVPDPEKIICLGLNYPEHAAELRFDVPPVPPLFAKFRNALTGPAGPIILPKASTQIDYEGELAVVIGRRCKDAPELDALGFVAGYTIMNDVSARDLQMQTGQWMAGKTLDTFAPMGPGIVPASDIPDPQKLRITTRLNDITVQQGNTGEMIFPVARTIAFLSSLMTLEPGDIIATGTPSGVGFKRNPPIFLKEGDVVEVEIEGIGMIRNPVLGQKG